MQLADYLEQAGISDGNFAKLAKVTIHAVRKWKSNVRMPRKENMLRIELVTGKKVAVKDWYK